MTVQQITEIDQAGMAAWNAHDAEAFANLCADDIVWNDVASPVPYKGKDGVRQFMKAWFTAFPDMMARVTNRVVGEDAVAAEVEFSGTNSGPMQMAPGAPAMPATNKKVVNSKGVYFAKVKDGKIIAFNSYPDLAGMMMQLGMMPQM